MHTVLRFRRPALAAAATLLFPVAAIADVTIEQTMKVDSGGLMGMLDMNGRTTTSISGNRSRTESEINMASRLIGMFAGGGRTADIVQLDQDRVYHIDLKKKTYTETTLSEQREAIQNAMAKMRETQTSQQQTATGMDSSQCEWSEPKTTVQRPAASETIAGYPAKRSVVTASQSCTDRETGQVCTFEMMLDQWRAESLQAGTEVENYWRTYAEKLGLDVSGSPDYAQRMQSMFGGYQGIWQKIAKEMQQTSGYPVRTTVSLAVGGPQCDAGGQASQSAAAGQMPGSAGSAQSTGMNESIGGAVGGVVGGNKGIGGLVGKSLGGILGRRRDEAARQASQGAPASTQSGTSTQAAAAPQTAATGQHTAVQSDGTVRLMSITTELLSVSDTPAAASAFEVPANFRKVP